MIIGFRIVSLTIAEKDVAIQFVSSQLFTPDSTATAQNIVERVLNGEDVFVYATITLATVAGAPISISPLYSTANMTVISTSDFPVELYYTGADGTAKYVRIPPTQYVDAPREAYTQFKPYEDKGYIRLLIDYGTNGDFLPLDFSPADFLTP